MSSLPAEKIDVAPAANEADHDPAPYLLIFSLGLLPGIAMLLSALVGPSAPYEWAENIGVFIAIGFGVVTIVQRPWRLLSSRTNRWIAGGTVVALVWMAVSIVMIASSSLIAAIASVMLVTGLSAGIVAYSVAEKDRELIFRLFLVATFVGNLATVVMPGFISWIGTPPAPYVYWSHALPGFGNVRVLGHFSAMGIAAGIGLFLIQPRDGSWRLPILAGLTLLWMIGFWGGTRALLVALVLAIPLAFAITRAASWREVSALTASAVTGSLLSILLPRPDSSFGIIQRLEGARTAMAETPGGLTTGRTQIWEWCLQKIAEYPLFGLGYNQIGVLGKPPLLVFHAHNVVLEWLVGFGLVFGTLMLAILAVLVLRAIRRAAGRRDPRQTAGLLLVFTLGTYAMFCATLYYPVSLIALSFGLAMATMPARERA